MWFTKKPLLPDIPSRNMVSVRMEAVGGQGANSAGKILAEAAVLGSGYTGNHFSSFGSEKRGTPVRSFVRFSTQKSPVRSASFISHPNLLVLFHESLMLSHPEILEGATDQTDVIINSSAAPDKLRFPENSVFRSVATVNATEIARTHQCGVNAVMLGALSKFCPEVSTDVLQKTLQSFFSKKNSRVSSDNTKGFLAGFGEVRWRSFHHRQGTLEVDNNLLPEMGWLNAPIGGIILNPGNSVLKDHSASRKGVAPKFNKEICFNCGFCDMVCPDFCFAWEVDSEGKKSPQLKGIDYQYCKGCQKCVAVCPVEALVPALEKDIGPDERSVKVYPTADRETMIERGRHLDWTAYVDQLSEPERMMTLQTELLNPESYLRPSFSDDLKSSKKSKKE